MKRKKLFDLLDKLKKEEKLVGKRAKELKNVANQTAKETVSSWSAGGDRFHTRNQAEAAEDLRFKILSLRKELEEAATKTPPENVVIPCFVNLILDNKKEEFYLVDQVINLPGARLISSNSLLGKAILGKRKGEDFSFQTEDRRKIEGKVVDFE